MLHWYYFGTSIAAVIINTMYLVQNVKFIDMIFEFMDNENKILLPKSPQTYFTLKIIFKTLRNCPILGLPSGSVVKNLSTMQGT